MKVRLFLLLYIASSILFSCSFSKYPDEKGHLVVYNKGGDSCVITDVYVKSEFGSGFERNFKGTIKNGGNYFIELPPDSYSVMISVSRSFGDVFVVTEEYETGYKIFRRIDAGKFVSVEFDGEGIFFK